MKKAFTLSEVLITLAIVGLISSLTIPSIVKSYQKKICATQIEKVFAQLSDAIQTAMVDDLSTQSFSAENDSNMSISWGDDTPDNDATFENSTPGLVSGANSGAVYLLDNYLKVADRDCVVSKSGDAVAACIADRYRNYNGEEISFSELGIDTSGKENGVHKTYCVLTVTGSAICITDRFNVFVDANGKNEPNMTGMDVYLMKIDKTTGQLTDIDLDDTKCNTKTPWAAGCLAKVMNAGWEIK